VLVQAPESAQFDGMPRSAMATGLVTYVLPIAKMPRVLLSYARHAYVSQPGTLPSGTRLGNPVGKNSGAGGSRPRPEVSPATSKPC